MKKLTTTKRLNKSQVAKIRRMVREKIKSGVKTTLAIPQVAKELDLPAGRVYHYYYKSGAPKKITPRNRKSNVLSVPIKSMYIQDNTLFITFESISNLNIVKV